MGTPNGMNKKVITISVLALVFVGVSLVLYNPKPSSRPPQDNSSTSGVKQKWETRTDEQANVTVVVTPLNLSSQSTEWKFDIGMNTHSVELDQDPVQIVTLVDDKGNVYKPLSWEGAGPGGHHREGVLIFNAIQPMPQTVELKIKDIGGIPERSFKWGLK